MQDEFHLRLTQEEGFLLLTGARLFDKLVAGVTIHAQERDELIREIIGKLSEAVNPQIEAMSNELADAIVDSVLGTEDLEDSELEELELAYLESDLEEMLLNDFFRSSQTENPPNTRQLPIEGLDCDPGADAGDFDLKQIDSEFRRSDVSCPSSFDARSRKSTGMSRDKEIEPRAAQRRLEKFLSEDTFAYPMYSVDEKLPVIEKALLKHHALRVHYYSIAREAVDTVFLNPLVLLQEDGMWLIVAYCHEKDDILIFRVDRMRDVEETEHTFETPKDINELRCKMLANYK
jgi:Predicted transcriptional regulator